MAWLLRKLLHVYNLANVVAIASSITMTVSKIAINGITFRIKREGSETSPLLVFSNSLMSTLESWDLVSEKFLERGFQLLRYDQIGHGQSSPPSGDSRYSLEDMTKQLHEIILKGAGEIKPYAVIGDSIGGIIALRYAMLFPDQVDRIVACSVPGMATIPATIDVWKERISTAENGGLKTQLAPSTIERWFMPSDRSIISQELRDKMTSSAQETSEAGYLACARALTNYNFRSDLGNIPNRTLLIAGKLDGNLPDVMKEFGEKIPHANLHIMEKSGHIPMVDNPTQFFDVVFGFLKSS